MTNYWRTLLVRIAGGKHFQLKLCRVHDNEENEVKEERMIRNLFKVLRTKVIQLNSWSHITTRSQEMSERDIKPKRICIAMVER